MHSKYLRPETADLRCTSVCEQVRAAEAHSKTDALALKRIPQRVASLALELYQPEFVQEPAEHPLTLSLRRRYIVDASVAHGFECATVLSSHDMHTVSRGGRGGAWVKAEQPASKRV